jgi:crotonobetainyl-CoA:carnitine CoA-transferase CaiB-like acyl-CoA transferase
MNLPLSGIVVLDLVQGSLAPLSRIYADLGAEVVRLERAAPGREADGHELAAEIGNLGKHLGRLDLAAAEGRALFEAHLARGDLVLTDGNPDVRDHLLGEAERRPQLVVLSATMFGEGNAYSGWEATDPVLHALSAGLSRSGVRGRDPLLPPGTIALNSAMAQAAYAGLAALYEALTTGRGDWIDFSALEGAVQALDPGFGSAGVAATGRRADQLSPLRPAKGFRYPIFACADGHVRICLLSPRQWNGMFRWMGEPAAFASAEFNATARRYQSPELTEALASFFRSHGKEHLEATAPSYGVPLSVVRRFEDCLSSDHLKARRAFTRAELPSGRSVRIPNGVVEIDGVRAGPRRARLAAASQTGKQPQLRGTGRPLAQIRVLDLGVIVVGAEQGRLLADLGADVVKVETASFPDGSRQSVSGVLSASFAVGHRNKRSLGLNLRHADGKALFLRLAAKADVIFSNFKPGTLESLGIDGATLARANPGLVTVESSAFGSSGPWSARMGYGPLVRAAAGVTEAWRYPDDAESYSDSITVYPDHAAGRAGAIAALALLIRRLGDGRGGAAKISQLEVMLDQFTAEIAAADLINEAPPTPPDGPWGVYRAAGDDDWCVVTVRNDEDWRRLAGVIGCHDPRFQSRQGRLEHRGAIDAAVSKWMRPRRARAAMDELQLAGVPAGEMLRVADLPSFPFFKARGFFSSAHHPSIDDEMIAERAPFRSRRLPAAAQNPAPLLGQHSKEVVRDWLALDDAEIAALVSTGVLEPGNT